MYLNLKKITTLCIGFVFYSNAYTQDVRGLYVNNFKHIIGNEVKEDSLLLYAKEQNFNYLLLYNISYINDKIFKLKDSIASLPLANFIYKAKTQYNISQIGMVGEYFGSYAAPKAYNDHYPKEPLKRFDVFNIEYEFWNKKLINSYYCDKYLIPNGLQCDTNGAFTHYISQLEQLNSLTNSEGVLSETYIGSPTETQNNTLAQYCDRILVHYYRKSDTYNNGNSIYNYKSYRLPDLAENQKVTILPIFASTDTFMFDWLKTNSLEKPYETFLNGVNGFNSDTGAWKSNVTIGGYQWYRYTELKELYELEPINISETPPLEVVVFPNPTFSKISFSNLLPNTTIELSSASGKYLNTYKNPNQIDLSSFKKGTYILRITEESKTYTKKIIVK